MSEQIRFTTHDIGKAVLAGSNKRLGILRMVLPCGKVLVGFPRAGKWDYKRGRVGEEVKEFSSGEVIFKA